MIASADDYNLRVPPVVRLPEPCLCGAPDCPVCFPYSWRESRADEIGSDDDDDDES
jgi:hypothetical protein